ncbi:SH3 domain-containing protein [Kosakonia cowanii]|uniref:SH3 domain-containing protein n=1 Tax=Kosakonia cowanii TaxID=208223 RepID=UPI00289B1007|nr:SH3 domain-containing protein [Kosakonia cowanii]
MKAVSYPVKNTVNVIRDYQSAYPDPLTIHEGERAQISHCDLQWRGWIWVTLESGKAGWAPQQLFTPVSAHEGICQQAYCAHELTVQSGEQLTVHQSLNGWYLAEKADGDLGWVPHEHVALA